MELERIFLTDTGAGAEWERVFLNETGAGAESAEKFSSLERSDSLVTGARAELEREVVGAAHLCFQSR